MYECFQFGGFESIEGILYTVGMESIHSNQTKASPRDIFLHLASIVALYGSAVSFLILVFQLINVWIPDISLGYYSYRSPSLIRGAIAALIVFFPMFITSLKMLSSSYKEDESRKKINIRKWLIYFTLFITAFVMAGDSISLIYNFLEGDLTLKFILKICAVFFVAVVIFVYYRHELKDSPDSKIKYIKMLVPAVVVISLVVGVIYAGSPFKERMRKMDDQRVNDLMMIQNYVVEYWQNKGELPQNLSMLNDNLRGINIPNDPESRSEYGYGIKGDDTFVLCAVFSEKTDMNDPRMEGRSYFGGINGSPTWAHDLGKHCFDRTIDKDFFKQNNVGIKPVF